MEICGRAGQVTNDDVVWFVQNEMGGACGTYGGGERCAQGSGWQT